MSNLIKKVDKIFVAGNLGMVGSAIIRKLKREKYRNILTVSKKDLDLTIYPKVEEWFLLNKPEVVIIAAAKVGGILANSKYPAEFLLNNLKIQNNLIELSYKFGVQRLLFLGSSCIYPKFAIQPIKEESLLTGSLESTNEYYALAKISGIKLCHALRMQYGFDAISLMPTNLYGPGDNYNLDSSHVIPALIKKFHLGKLQNKPVSCWGSGIPLREFLHVDDLANACIYSLEKLDFKDRDYSMDNKGNPLSFLNIGSGEELSIKDLANKVANIVGYTGKIIWDIDKPDGTPRKLLDSSRIRMTGWEPKIDLIKGLKNTYEEFKKIFIKFNN